MMRRTSWNGALLFAGVLGAAGATMALGSAPALAQQLTVERIFAGEELSPRGLPALQWMEDGRRFTFLEDDGEGGTDLWLVDAGSGERSRLVEGARLVPPGELQPIPIEGYDWSRDGSKLLVYTNSQRVWRQNTKGVYYVLDLASGELRPVSRNWGWQQFAKFSPDGTRVGFVRDHDLFVVDLETGRETRLTFDGSETIINGTFDWVYEEELDLQDGWRWSPDGRRISFWRLDQSPVSIFELHDLSTTYPTPFAIPYPKAGEPNSFVRIGVVDLDAGGTTWMDLGENPDIYLARMDWASSADELVLQRLNRAQNRIDVMLADVRTGRTRTILADTDEAWVDVDDDLTWVEGGRRFIWSSEKDGYHHLYLHDRDGRQVRQLTRGDWDVTSYHGYDAEGGWVYFTATERGPLERHLYRVRLDGRGLERLTAEPGVHSASVAPGFRYFIDSHSRSGVPPTVRLHRTDGEAVRVLAENGDLAARLDSMGLARPEFFTFPTADGVELNGWMIRPPGFDPTRRYPVLMYVYGGPGSQTVTDGWGGSRYLWHQLLAERGYIVASVDNRGTGGRGRDFKKITYLDLGNWETRDQLEAARHLAGLPYVDPERIGIWGWSYGGYMTLLALTHEAGGDLFRMGVSVAPVTHWKLYDTIYTERFMRTPANNPEGYERSAPLNRAENLRSRLLLVHGSGDDNVHFQQSVQMIDALVDANKQFTFMMYPNRTHSIRGGNSSVHLHTLMTQWIEENL